MKKDGKYKFNLQFPSETQEQIRAGELLERLGHQKSTIVVEAVNAYIIQHPELMGSNCKIEIHNNTAFDREMMEQLIRDMVTEHLANMSITEMGTQMNINEGSLDADIAQMLDNLDFFQ